MKDLLMTLHFQIFYSWKFVALVFLTSPIRNVSKRRKKSHSFFKLTKQKIVMEPITLYQKENKQLWKIREKINYRNILYGLGLKGLMRGKSQKYTSASQSLGISIKQLNELLFQMEKTLYNQEEIMKEVKSSYERYLKTLTLISETQIQNL